MSFLSNFKEWPHIAKTHNRWYKSIRQAWSSDTPSLHCRVSTRSLSSRTFKKEVVLGMTGGLAVPRFSGQDGQDHLRSIMSWKFLKWPKKTCYIIWDPPCAAQNRYIDPDRFQDEATYSYGLSALWTAIYISAISPSISPWHLRTSTEALPLASGLALGKSGGVFDDLRGPSPTGVQRCSLSLVAPGDVSKKMGPCWGHRRVYFMKKNKEPNLYGYRDQFEIDPFGIGYIVFHVLIFMKKIIEP